LVVCNGKKRQKRGPTIRGGAKKDEKMVCIMQEKCKDCCSMCSDRAKREEWRGLVKVPTTRWR
jgi:hypothetical protein